MRTFLFLLIGVNLAIAQPAPTCDGQYPGRIPTCTESLQREQSPNKLVKIYIYRAQAYDNWSRQYDLAVKDYDAALLIDPDNIEALYGRGGAFANMQEYSRALADADSLIALGERAKGYAVHEQRCRALAGLGRFDEAISACSVSLNRYPTDRVFVQRGEVYLLAGQHDHAIEDFDAALKIQNDNGFAILGRGKAFLAKHEYEAALEEFDKANRLSLSNSDQDWGFALSGHGLANEALGRREAAIADFRRALRAYSDLTEAKDGLKRLGASPMSTPNAPEKPWWRFW